MKPRWPLLDPAQLKDDFDSWRSGLVFPVQSALQEMRAFMTNGITFADNMNAAIIEFDAVHGTEALFTPPDKIKVPLTFIPISAALPSNAGFINIASKSQINYQPLMSTGAPRTDGRLGITVNYAPPVETQRIARARSASTAMLSTVPKNICATPSVILTAGEWLVSGAVGFNTTAGAGTTFLDASISLGTGALSGADTICLPTSGEARNYNNENHTGNDYSVFIPPYRTSVSASTTKTLYLVGNIVTAAANASAFGYLEAVRLTTDPATIARVRGILVGG